MSFHAAFYRQKRAIGPAYDSLSFFRLPRGLLLHRIARNNA